MNTFNIPAYDPSWILWGVGGAVVVIAAGIVLSVLTDEWFMFLGIGISVAFIGMAIVGGVAGSIGGSMDQSLKEQALVKLGYSHLNLGADSFVASKNGLYVEGELRQQQGHPSTEWTVVEIQSTDK